MHRQFVLVAYAAWPLVMKAQRPAKILRIACLAVLSLLAAPSISEAQEFARKPRGFAS